MLDLRFVTIEFNNSYGAFSKNLFHQQLSHISRLKSHI